MQNKQNERILHNQKESYSRVWHLRIYWNYVSFRFGRKGEASTSRTHTQENIFRFSEAFRNSCATSGKRSGLRRMPHSISNLLFWPVLFARLFRALFCCFFGRFDFVHFAPIAFIHFVTERTGMCVSTVAQFGNHRHFGSRLTMRSKWHCMFTCDGMKTKVLQFNLPNPVQPITFRKSDEIHAIRLGCVFS